MKTRLRVLALGLGVLATTAACGPASGPTATPIPPAATATPVPPTRVPTRTAAPAGNAVPPAAVQTGGPAPVQTGGPAPVQTGGPAPLTPNP